MNQYKDPYETRSKMESKEPGFFMAHLVLKVVDKYLGFKQIRNLKRGCTTTKVP